MYIKFANTLGEAYDYLGTTLDFAVGLGDLITFEDGIVIVDRSPLQETTQLEVEKIIDALRYILNACYSQQTEELSIYLPRMDANISNQAKIQEAFANLTNPGDNKITYFNIKVIHV